MDRVPLIVWSGGLDSTAMIQYAIGEGITFDTLYINLANNEKKSKGEKESRKKLVKLFDKYYNNYFPRKEYEVDIPIINNYNNADLNQPILWLSALALVVEEKQTSEIRMGYVKGDCFWSIKHDFTKAWYHLYKTAWVHGGVEPPEMKFPLEWFDKKDLGKSLYTDVKFEGQLKILNNIWVCECPIEQKEDVEQCGCCLKCKELTEIKKYIHRERGNKEYELGTTDFGVEIL